MQPDWVTNFLGGVVLVEAWLLMRRNTDLARANGELYGLRRQVADFKDEARAWAEWPAWQKELMDCQMEDASKLDALRARTYKAERQRDAALIALGERTIGDERIQPQSQRNTEGVPDA